MQKLELHIEYQHFFDYFRIGEKFRFEKQLFSCQKQNILKKFFCKSNLRFKTREKIKISKREQN